MNWIRFLMLLIVLCSLAVSAPLVRFAHAPALTIVLWRFLFAWPFFAGVALAKREKWPGKYAVFAGIMLALHLIAWVIAVQTTTKEARG